jgi:EF-hand domain pair
MTNIDDIPLECKNPSELRAARILLPQLFEILDEDNSGTIDPFELLKGLRQYTAAKGGQLEARKCFNILDEVDSNKDHVLTLREFCIFICKLTNAMDVSVYDFVRFMVNLLGDSAKPDSKQNTIKNPQKQNLFDRLLGSLKAEEK